MKLILDTNILIAALIKDSITREIILHPEIECIVSEFLINEVDALKDEILRKSRLSKENFEELLENIKEKLIFIPDEEIHHKKEATRIMEPIDIKDSIFIALALTTKNEGIWSEDKHFEKQHRIKVWKTKDLIKYLDIKH